MKKILCFAATAMLTAAACSGSSDSYDEKLINIDEKIIEDLFKSKASLDNSKIDKELMMMEKEQAQAEAAYHEGVRNDYYENLFFIIGM